MRQSHYITPRSLDECNFSPAMDPITRYPQSGLERAYGVFLAVAIGMGLALALVSWWTS